MNASYRSSIILSNGDRIDPITQINMTEAVRNGDNTALETVTVAQLSCMLNEDHDNEWVAHSLKLAQKRLARCLAKDRAIEANTDRKFFGCI